MFYVSAYSSFNCGYDTDNTATLSSYYTWSVGNLTANITISDLGNDIIQFDLNINCGESAWAAIGFPLSDTNAAMLGSDVGMIAKDSDGNWQISDYFIGTEYRYATCPGGVCQDTARDDGTTCYDNLSNKNITRLANGNLLASFTRHRAAEDDCDNALAAQDATQSILIASGTYSSNSYILYYHGNNKVIKYIQMPGTASSPSPSTTTSSASLNLFGVFLSIVCFLAQIMLK